MTNIDTERDAAMAEGNRIYKQPSDVDAFVQGWLARAKAGGGVDKNKVADLLVYWDLYGAKYEFAEKMEELRDLILEPPKEDGE